ncbi:hypothetical protein KFL_002890040 [Klebsormidium nitens]|uniref:Prenylcysteine lyase domain-containing protein n=1 Tax=Klebsormidium nitens TaxID=105231 RepID=A0A1Y1ICI0_KLENI|nr:hypothetical protein KFL_002890040 [Klebsormidium nitens]|eukprot:GAQ86437.1 hypothetical protein KFL_002890040 [Klebsormidium nitens]
MSLVLFPLLLAGLLVSHVGPCTSEKVAIVGGGVGGAAAAYYLHKADGHAEIHLFEREQRLGGTLQEVTFEGRVVELGHPVFHKKNKLSAQLVEELGLETAVPQGLDGSYGIFDGESFVYREGANDTNADDWRRFFKYLTRYTLNIRGMKFNIQAYLENWEKLLDDPPFEDVPDLLDMVNMVEKATYTLAQDLADSYGALTLRDFGAASTRFVLGQDPPIVNSVAAHQALSVSRACRADQLWSVKGGAKQLVQKLVDQSKATVHLGHDVNGIDARADGVYEVRHKGGGKTVSEAFDVVIISAPLDPDELALPDGVDAGPDIDWLDQEVTLVKGTLNQTTFKVGKNETLPDVIATVDTVFFPIHALRRLWTFPDGEHAFLVTMAEKMTDEMVNDCFSHVSKIKRMTLENVWPDLSAKGKGAKYPPIQLDGKKLLFPAAVESVVSGLEATIISARNAVRLLLEPKEAPIEESVVAVEEATERVNVGKVPEHVLGEKTGAETADLPDRTEL